MKIRELLTTWTFNIDNKSLNRMDRKIGDLRNNAKAFGANMKSVTDGMVSQGLRLTAFVTLPIVGIGAAMTKAASDAEETLAKFDTVFQEVGDEANKTALSLSRDFGLSSKAAKQLLGDTGDLLTGFGFTGDMALDLSKNVNELAVDLASFTNFAGGAEGASAALTKALLGERESVKSLGISILEEDVKAKIASLEATGELTNETNRQKKAIATLAIAVEQSKNAQGDFARTQDSLANQTRIFMARIDDLAVSFGQILIPIVSKMVVGLTNLAEKFEGLSTNTKEWILISLGVIAVLAPMLLIAGLLGSAILALGSAFTLLKAALIAVRAASLSTILLWAAIPIAIGLVIIAAGLLLDDIWELATGGESAIGTMIESWGTWGVFITERIQNAAQWLKFFWSLSTLAGEGIVAAFVSMGDGIVTAFDFVIQQLDIFFNWVDAKVEAISNIGGKIGSFLSGAFGDFFGTNEATPGVSPAQNIAQAATLPAATLPALNRAGGTTVNNVDVRPTINLEVPAGTPEDQQRILSESAKTASEEVFNREVRKMINENPEVS